MALLHSKANIYLEQHEIESIKQRSKHVLFINKYLYIQKKKLYLQRKNTNHKTTNIMTFKRLSIFLLLCMSALTACQDDTMFLSTQQELEAQQTDIKSQPDDMMVLGQELQDPYNLAIMQQAYANITGAKAQLQPTHRYYRFLPKNDDELDMLKYSGMELFDFPLHYEVLQGGSRYHDPELPAEAITWQYAVVPVEKTIPEGIKYELLYDVFIPTDDIDGAKNNLFEAIEAEAMRLSGHEDELQQDGSKGLLPAKWTPSGTIKVWDDAFGEYIPLKGAKVRARHLTHVELTYTNVNGYYQTPTFRYDVNYDIIWEHMYFDIRDGNIGQAKYDGPKQRTGWSKYIGKGDGKQLMFATIYRIAYKMYYEDNLGMTRPFLRNDKSTKIAYIDEYNPNQQGQRILNFNLLGIIPNIQIWGRTSSGSLVHTHEVLFTTAHELGHQIHAILMTGVQFLQISNYVAESWAEAVGWAITKDEYNYWSKKLKIYSNINEYDQTYQYKWPNTNNIEYTPIFVDLVDEYNQGLNNPNLPNDMVSGYTMKFINDIILPNSYG